MSQNQNPTARELAQIKQCRLAQYKAGRMMCIDRNENSPGCPCEKFCDCRLGLHIDPELDILWKYYDQHDYFPDWHEFYLDMMTE